MRVCVHIHTCAHVWGGLYASACILVAIASSVVNMHAGVLCICMSVHACMHAHNVAT